MELCREARPAVRKKILLFILLGWVLLIIGDRVDELRVYQGAQIAMYTIALASIVLLTGYSGQVSLGNGAMMAVGGYAAALTLNNLQTPIWLLLNAIIASAILAPSLVLLQHACPVLIWQDHTALAVGLPAMQTNSHF